VGVVSAKFGSVACLLLTLILAGCSDAVTEQMDLSSAAIAAAKERARQVPFVPVNDQRLKYPMNRSDLFFHAEGIAYHSCDMGPDYLQISAEECLVTVHSKHSQCADQTPFPSTGLIESKKEAGSIRKAYLICLGIF
jgi:hypothetical protein